MTIGTLSTLQDWLTGSGIKQGDKFPPERVLSSQLGISRAELRKALALLEANGTIVRNVGRGTFLKLASKSNASDFNIAKQLAEVTSPHNAMMARLALEPEIAGFAAIHASPRHLSEARNLCERMRLSQDWHEYESLDSRFHELIAIASGNPVLTELHRIVNAVRISVVWSRLDLPQDGPPPDYHSFDEHDAILNALDKRDRVSATNAMRAHLKSVRATLLKDD